MTMHIVYAPNRDGYSALFAMKSDDFRFGTENYRTVGTLTKYGRNFVDAETGRVYQRFVDWSLRECSLSGAETLADVAKRIGAPAPLTQE